jgi:phosphatidylglycerol---prolipoprotein diacylglyceryl transferase
VPIAVITFTFDPFVQLFGDLSVRWGAIVLTIVITVAIVLAGLLARGAGLRADDVVFITVGVVPGAVIGGRVGYLLLHPGFANGELARLIDPSLGGLELGLAVVGGTLTGSYVAGLLRSAPLGRWLHLAAAPALLAIGAGKLTMILTGSGQGVPTDAAWATAYLGPGPWGSLVPGLPSVPSQAFEGVATLGILVVLTLSLLGGAFRARDGRLFFIGIGLWAIARAAISTTWRDEAVAAGLPVGGLIAVAIALGCVLATLVITVQRRRADAAEAQRGDLAWPDPETRPRF